MTEYETLTQEAIEGIKKLAGEASDWQVIKVSEHPWDQNDHGLWCPACGNAIASQDMTEDEDFEPPASCRQCGFPDFENGTEYFTDDEERAE